MFRFQLLLGWSLQESNSKMNVNTMKDRKDVKQLILSGKIDEAVERINQINPSVFLTHEHRNSREKAADFGKEHETQVRFALPETH